MGVSITHVCGRGRGATSARMVLLSCDFGGCWSTVRSWSKDDYDRQLAAGWRVEEGKRAMCPTHSGARPAVDVQQELAL